MRRTRLFFHKENIYSFSPTLYFYVGTPEAKARFEVREEEISWIYTIMRSLHITDVIFDKELLKQIEKEEEQNETSS